MGLATNKIGKVEEHMWMDDKSWFRVGSRVACASRIAKILLTNAHLLAQVK